jgi:hypothetical protein
MLGLPPTPLRLGTLFPIMVGTLVPPAGALLPVTGATPMTGVDAPGIGTPVPDPGAATVAPEPLLLSLAPHPALMQAVARDNARPAAKRLR